MCLCQTRLHALVLVLPHVCGLVGSTNPASGPVNDLLIVVSSICYTSHMQASLRRTEQELRQANKEITFLRRRSVI